MSADECKPVSGSQLPDSHASDEKFTNQQSPTDTDNNILNEDRIIRHIMVIGFHHKHGYQVDYCYPPLERDGPCMSSNETPICLPELWRTLPLLCLPDGSHNYDSDTIYFTMPDNRQSQESREIDSDERDSKSNINKTEKARFHGIKTIFGTACYRQIQADKLLNRTDDMTRIAVQKSVCILSTKPLFGLIRSKLEMITHAYFEELDFSKVGILKLTYDNLNASLARDTIKENSTFLGLSARSVISQFGYNTLVIFKAMLLEKKILFYKTPVRDLCSTILSICSLFTGLLESGGLDYSTCDLQLSASHLEALKLMPQKPSLEALYCDQALKSPAQRDEKVLFSPAKEQVVIINQSTDTVSIQSPDSNRIIWSHRENNIQSTDDTTNLDLTSEKDMPVDSDFKPSMRNINKSDEELNRTAEYVLIGDINFDDGSDDEGTAASLADLSLAEDQFAMKLCRLNPEDCGLPLQIFSCGSFCLPYLSITYLDILSDERVNSFVIGATNFLFKQKKEMYDVIVDMEENNIIINDIHLKRCLTLTTEDLRFMDNLSRQVKMEPTHTSPKNEFDFISHDVTRWVGGDEWIRYHFTLYLLYLLKISRSTVAWKLFNSYFVQAWKQTTNNYRIWSETGKGSLVDQLQCRHPSSGPQKGPLNFNDMKLKLSYAVNTSEKGRMINQTLNGIGKWSIWNNIASAAGAAATSAAATISSASNQIVHNAKSSNLSNFGKSTFQIPATPQDSQVTPDETVTVLPESGSSTAEKQKDDNII